MYASKAYIKHTFLQACRRYVRPVILYAWGDIHELKCMLESIHFTFSKLGKIFTQTVALVLKKWHRVASQAKDHQTIWGLRPG